MNVGARLQGVVGGALATALLLAGAAGCGGHEDSWSPNVTTGSGGTGSSMPGFGGGSLGGSSGGITGLGGRSSTPVVPGTGNSCGAVGGAGGRGSRPLNPPTIGTTVTQTVAPPAISGGTMRVLADGVTVVAADPDRDQVYVVDLTNRSLRATVKLEPGDEPGRVITDGAGRAHVALRRGGAVVTLDPATGTVVTRRAVCAAPRGLAYDPALDLIHVACAGGELVSLPAAGGAAVRTVQLDRDLRDVVVDGPRLRVSRFRSASVLSVESDGTVSKELQLPSFKNSNARMGQTFTPSVAYQMVGAPDGSVVVLHQRGVVDAITGAAGSGGMASGYGDVNPCNAVVHPAVSVVTPSGEVKAGPVLAGMVLAVDLAISGDGSRVAVVAAGNAYNRQSAQMVPSVAQRVFVSDLTGVSESAIGCSSQGVGNPTSCATVSPPPTGTPDGGAPADARLPPSGSPDAGASSGLCSSPDVPIPEVVGEPIAVAFAGDRTLIVQSREPAMLALGDGSVISLSPESRADTGHLVFHANAGNGVACASCHAEGNDDGRVWTFACSGARRTQSLQTGLQGTEPFHWSGDEADFSHLMNDVFVGRMSGPPLATDQQNVLLSWIDRQPRLPALAVRDQDAVHRGRALFEDTKRAACVSCHSGARFSNNTTADVGTGAPFQVPSLLGIGSRGPFMHDGCAPTLLGRFSPACGGSAHGGTTDLTAAETADLVTYLESL